MEHVSRTCRHETRSKNSAPIRAYNYVSFTEHMTLHDGACLCLPLTCSDGQEDKDERARLPPHGISCQFVAGAVCTVTYSVGLVRVRKTMTSLLSSVT